MTIFDSVGFALEDYSALRYMRDAAIELGLAERLSLIPDLANPKDLFGFIDGNANGGADHPVARPGGRATDLAEADVDAVVRSARLAVI